MSKLKDLIKQAPSYVRREDIIKTNCTDSVVDDLDDCQKNILKASEKLQTAYNICIENMFVVNGTNPFEKSISDILKSLDSNNYDIDKFRKGIMNAPFDIYPFDEKNYIMSKEWIDKYRSEYYNAYTSELESIREKINDRIKAENESWEIISIYDSRLEHYAKKYNISVDLQLKPENAIKEMPHYSDCIAGKYGITYLVFNDSLSGLTKTEKSSSVNTDSSNSDKNATSNAKVDSNKTTKSSKTSTKKTTTSTKSSKTSTKKTTTSTKSSKTSTKKTTTSTKNSKTSTKKTTTDAKSSKTSTKKTTATVKSSKAVNKKSSDSEKSDSGIVYNIPDPTLDVKKSGSVPSSVKQSGYTVTCYGRGGWYLGGGPVARGVSRGTKQEKVHNLWIAQGCRYKNGIAVLNVNGVDRYLVALSSSFGVCGDVVDIKLANGQVIPAILGDEKGSRSNKYGHPLNNGTVNILEFEVDRNKYNSLGNPTTSKWGLDWDSSSPVVQIDNYGSAVV